MYLSGDQNNPWQVIPRQVFTLYPYYNAVFNKTWPCTGFQIDYLDMSIVSNFIITWSTYNMVCFFGPQDSIIMRYVFLIDFICVGCSSCLDIQCVISNFKHEFLNKNFNLRITY